MKAVVYNEYAPDGNYSKILKVQDIDEPKPKADEVVFKLKSAALNYNDIWGMRGVRTSMNPLLITGFGTSINVDKRKLIITNKLKDTRLEFFPHKINHDGIIIDGHTGNITFEAMRWLMKHNINLTLPNWNGQLLANVMPEQPKSGKLRIKQPFTH